MGVIYKDLWEKGGICENIWPVLPPIITGRPTLWVWGGGVHGSHSCRPRGVVSSVNQRNNLDVITEGDNHTQMMSWSQIEYRQLQYTLVRAVVWSTHTVVVWKYGRAGGRAIIADQVETPGCATTSGWLQRVTIWEDVSK